MKVGAYLNIAHDCLQDFWKGSNSIKRVGELEEEVISLALFDLSLFAILQVSFHDISYFNDSSVLLVDYFSLFLLILFNSYFKNDHKYEWYFTSSFLVISDEQESSFIIAVALIPLLSFSEISLIFLSVIALYFAN